MKIKLSWLKWENILIPVGIFFYIPISFYLFIIVWGGIIDMMVHWNFIKLSGILSTGIGLIIWLLVTWFLGLTIVRQCGKDRKFIILAVIPVILFFSTYFINYLF